MSDNIKAVLKTNVWKELEEIFQVEINQLKDATVISYDLDNETYAREVRARAAAAVILESFIKKVKLAGRDEKTQPRPSFK